MSTDLVCPQCGESAFTQTRSARIVEEVRVMANGEVLTMSHEIDGVDDQPDTVECMECGYTLDLDELVTPDTYDYGDR